jgi:hypothetical protein
MSTTTKLDKHEQGKKMDIKGYQGMIDILLYLTTSKPDIMFSVGLYARFKTSHRESPFHVVKCIFRYLKGTIRLGFWYPRMNNFYLISYSDPNFASFTVNKKKN